ncbi:MAG: hypothetical protein WBQ37_13200 [Candidatus Competibacter sp.]
MNVLFDPNNQAKGTDSVQVEMVRNTLTGEILDVASWIPCKTEGEMHQLRFKIRQSNNSETAIPALCYLDLFFNRVISDHRMI